MARDSVWGVEQFMLSIYLMLVHRVEGIGLSLDDFWEMDTWTTSFFYLSELAIIEEEQRSAKQYENKSGGDGYGFEENEETVALYEEMFVDESEDY